ncbi:MAG: lipid-binding SYLF domain-containing protein [Syntrophobacteraceae bacterium]
MRYLIIPLLIFGFCLAPMPAQVGAATQDDIARINSATAVLNEIMAIPDNSLPESLLKDAHGIAVFPSMIKAAFGIGAQYGRGVFVARTEDGNWSPPSLLTLAGGSAGLQIGAGATDLILVFMTKNSVDALGRGDLTLGANASIAAGPVGRWAQASTDIQLRAEIYSYSKSRGIFAGVALDGTLVTVDTAANLALYGSPDPLKSAASIPEAASRFSCVVSKYTGSPGLVCA